MAKPVRERSSAMKRALIIIDVQNDYIDGTLPIAFPPAEQSLANIGRAMDGARTHDIPVVAVQNILPGNAPFMARGSRGAELHGVVTDRGWDLLVTKHLPSALWGTGLDTWLRERQIDTLTVAGYMTHNCDLSTVIHGAHAGYRMELLSDATGALPYANRAGSATAEELHRASCVVMQARFAAVLTTGEWLACLATGDAPVRDTIFDSHQRALTNV